MRDLRETVAFSMWKAEADRAAPNVGKNRTPEGFAEASEQERTRWLMLADAAMTPVLREVALMVYDEEDVSYDRPWEWWGEHRNMVAVQTVQLEIRAAILAMINK